MLKSYTHFREETNFYHSCDRGNYPWNLEGKVQVAILPRLHRMRPIKIPANAYDLSTARKLMLPMPFRGYKGTNE
jgi:hypothetical protein